MGLGIAPREAIADDGLDRVLAHTGSLVMKPRILTEELLPAVPTVADHVDGRPHPAVPVLRRYLQRVITHPFDTPFRTHFRREHDGLAEQRRMGLAAEGHEYVSVRDVECSHRAGPGIGGRRAHARLCAVGGE